MLSPFGTLNMGTRSLQGQPQGVETAGHNLANVNNPADSRQRLAITPSPAVATMIGPQGTGAEGVAIRQLRSSLLDLQIHGETGVQGFLEAQQSALQLGQAVLGQLLDRNTTGSEGSAGATAAGGMSGIAQALDDIFTAFQSLSTSPTSVSERHSALLRAQNLATQFNQIDGRLGTLDDTLNDTVKDDVTQVNELLQLIANYNQQIQTAEAGSPGSANDLRDLRQQGLEELAKRVNIQTAELPGGSIEVAIGATTVISESAVPDQLETYDAGDGRRLVRTQTGGTPLPLTGGAIEGTIKARDGALAQVHAELNTLATELITQVNAIHRNGFGLNGTAGLDFFTGNDGSNIAVNQAILEDPSRLQTSGMNGAVGDNQVALALAQLGNTPQATLAGQTFSQSYPSAVAALGQSLWTVTAALSDQDIVQKMLLRQRDSISGVSLDEEMTDLVKFQTAFEASARLIDTVDEMRQTILSLNR